MEGVAITDAGVRHLLAMKKLNFLILNGTKVTDNAIPSLAKLTTLRYLDLLDTRVTSTQIEKLRRLLPNADVWGHNAEDDDMTLDRN